MTQHLEGAAAPFSLELGVARLRDEGLLKRAMVAFQNGRYADALLDAEAVCRRQPAMAVPATLRATLLQRALPSMAAKAWYAAWCRDPLDLHLQDAMLQAFVECKALETVRSLGAAFLPTRFRTQHGGSLASLLQAAGAPWAGACWIDGASLQGRLFDFSGANTPTVCLRLSDGGSQSHSWDVPGDGTLFSIPFPAPNGVWSVAIDPDVEQLAPGVLAGSPLVLDDVLPAVPAASPVGRRRGRSDGVHIIIPVYRDRHRVQGCIESVLGSVALNRTPVRITVVNDASPDPELAAWLDALPAYNCFELLRNPFNLGFIETCNRALRLHAGFDALLLNADTMVHGDWVDRMHAALHAQADIASVTPWSNNGEISSFPTIGVAAAMPNAVQLAQMDDAVAALSKAGHVQDADIPSGCGFAMLMRRAVLDQIGLLDGIALNRGYSEEVDWCQRASAQGYRHRLAGGVFVAHAGAASFGYEKTLRVAQNRAVIKARYPEFYTQYHQFLRQDPLVASRSALLQALRTACPGWLAAARPANVVTPVFAAALPPPLPAASRRIAVWHYDMRLANTRKILTLARLIASRPSTAPQLRLLVFGNPGDELWRTGVVDVLPRVATRDAGLLSDTLLIGWCDCTCVFSEDTDLDMGAIHHVFMGPAFDPQEWLMRWASLPRQAA